MRADDAGANCEPNSLSTQFGWRKHSKHSINKKMWLWGAGRFIPDNFLYSELEEISRNISSRTGQIFWILIHEVSTKHPNSRTEFVSDLESFVERVPEFLSLRIQPRARGVVVYTRIFRIIRAHHHEIVQCSVVSLDDVNTTTNVRQFFFFFGKHVAQSWARRGA